MKKTIVILILFLIAILSACGQEDSEKTSLRIARQYGLAYAPLEIAREKHFIEAEIDNVDLTWVQLANTAAIRETMVSGNLDIGFMGIPPFLLGYDQKMPWKIFCGVAESPLGLMTKDATKKNLKDFVASDKIALPQPGSIQHILLMMGAERQLKNSRAFDEQLLAMKHPDAMAMLLNSNELAAHFTSPPYLFEERAQGLNCVLSGEDAFGGNFTFIVGTVYENSNLSKEAIKGVISAVERAQVFILENPDESLDILSRIYEMDKKTLHTYLYDSDMVYQNKVIGVSTFSEFMHRAGYISKHQKESDVLWQE